MTITTYKNQKRKNRMNRETTNLGLKSKKAHDWDRVKEIADALKRTTERGFIPPTSWVTELVALLDTMGGNKQFKDEE